MGLGGQGKKKDQAFTDKAERSYFTARVECHTPQSGGGGETCFAGSRVEFFELCPGKGCLRVTLLMCDTDRMIIKM